MCVCVCVQVSVFWLWSRWLAAQRSSFTRICPTAVRRRETSAAPWGSESRQSGWAQENDYTVLSVCVCVDIMSLHIHFLSTCFTPDCCHVFVVSLRVDQCWQGRDGRTQRQNSSSESRTRLCQVSQKQVIVHFLSWSLCFCKCVFGPVKCQTQTEWWQLSFCSF